SAQVLWQRYRDFVDSFAIQLAWIIALVALLGSLYYSEIVGFIPCRLCWYQRIGIYPLSVILLVATITVDRGVRKYVIPLNIITAVISIWHILEERFPSLSKAISCSADAPCSAILVQKLGFVTIPTMALAASLSILTLMLLLYPQGQDLTSQVQAELQ